MSHPGAVIGCCDNDHEDHDHPSDYLEVRRNMFEGPKKEKGHKHDHEDHKHDHINDQDHKHGKESKHGHDHDHEHKYSVKCDNNPEHDEEGH